ncbi:unnamed protein product, partial [Symbiodinium necroappetens]
EVESQRTADRGEHAKQMALLSNECQKKMDELSAHNTRILDKVVKERQFAEDKSENHLKLYEATRAELTKEKEHREYERQKRHRLQKELEDLKAAKMPKTNAK